MAITQESQPLSSPSLLWSEYNELLKERNDLHNFFPQLRERFRSLEEENQKDPQHPKKYPNVTISNLGIAKSYQGITWRDTWGTAKSLCDPDGFPVPSYVTIYLRCQEIDLKPLLGPEVGTESDLLISLKKMRLMTRVKGKGTWRMALENSSSQKTSPMVEIPCLYQHI